MRVHLLACLLSLLIATQTRAQAPSGPPPSVGVVAVEVRPVTESAEFIGRVAATDRVLVTARVTSYLEQRLFTEGTEVQEGDLLFRLDPQQFLAEQQRQHAVVAEARARLDNATLTLQREQRLVGTPAARRSTLDDAVWGQRSAAAQLMSAEAQQKVADLNVAYTEIRAPISGKIGRAAVTAGNVVGPGSGVLATIVSQDPMDVLFPVATRTLLELEARHAPQGGLRSARVRVRLSNGAIHEAAGVIDYVDPTVAPNTDTIMLRARVPNPMRRTNGVAQPVERGLIDGTLVTAIVEGPTPVSAMSIPRAAILSDQQGNYVFVVGADNRVELRRIRLGQSSAAVAVVDAGLREGERVIVEGIQRARPGAPVDPSPAFPQPGSSRPGAS